MSKALVAAGGKQLEPRPVKLPGFEFYWDGRVVVDYPPAGKGKPSPTVEQFQAALSYACTTYKASPLWVGYLLAYAEDREDWIAMFDQAIAFTGLSASRLHHLTSVVRNVAHENLLIAQSTAHATEVKALPPKQQKKWLDKSATEGWSKSQLRVEMRKAKRPQVSQATTEPAKMLFDRARLERVATEVLELEQRAMDAGLEGVADHLSDAYSDLTKAVEAVEDLKS